VAIACFYLCSASLPLLISPAGGLPRVFYKCSHFIREDNQILQSQGAVKTSRPSILICPTHAWCPRVKLEEVLNGAPDA
jgi:hypothetical protein